jgi:hypothetical protein
MTAKTVREVFPVAATAEHPTDVGRRKQDQCWDEE